MPERDVEFEITATDRSKAATEGAAHGFEQLSDKADKAARSTDRLGDQTGQLARKLLEARAAAAGLAREFDRTGDSKILREFGKINAEATRLGRVAKSIKLDVDLPKDVKTPDGLLGKFVKFGRDAGLIAGEASIKGFSDVFKALPGNARTAMIGALVGVGVAAAPLIAASVEGAVLGGVSAGALGIGLVLASKSDAVKSTYTKLAGDIGGDLKRAAQPLADQLIAIAPTLGYEFNSQLPRIQRTFAALAAPLNALIHDAMASYDAIAPSLERAAVVGGRVLASVGQQLPALAASVGKLLDAFSDAGPGAADALAAVVQQLSLLIRLAALGAQASAPMLNILGAISEFLHLTPNSNEEISKLTALSGASGRQASLTAEQYAMLNFQLGNTADRAKALGDAFNRLFSEQMGVDQANLAVNTGLLSLTETIKGNKKSLDESTQAGTQNVGVILQQIENLNRKREADIAAGNGTEEATQKANAAYASQIEGLRKLLYSLGLNHAEVDKLIDAYAELAKPQTKVFTTVFKQVGSQSGISDQSTGHSRTGTNDYGALSSWAPTRFAAAEHFAPGGDGTGAPAVQPLDVHSELSLVLELDGEPFRAQVVRTTRAAEKRQAWRARVGARQ